MSRWWIVGTAGVIVLAAVVVLALLRRSAQAETWTVQRGDIEATIEVNGRVTPGNPMLVTARVSSQVETVAVGPGDRVRAGDILVTLDRSSLDARLRQAESQLLNAELAVARLERAGSDASREDLILAEQRLREAEVAYQDARDALSEAFVLSPIDGVVLDVPVTSGTPVGPGSVVARLTDLRDLGVGVGFDEVDLAYLQLGDPVSVVVDAFPGQELAGRIVRLSEVAQQTGGVTSFPGFVALELPPELDVRPGMTATVYVRAVLRRDVLLVPERALRTVGERTFVTVLTENGEEEREIRVGLRSGGMVEVAAGLREGDRVLLRP